MGDPHVRIRPDPPRGIFAWSVDRYDGRGAWQATALCATLEDARRHAARVRRILREERLAVRRRLVICDDCGEVARSTHAFVPVPCSACGGLMWWHSSCE